MTRDEIINALADAEARLLLRQNGACERCGEPIETEGERHCIACREVADDGE